ncbi:hypothetical protein RJ639_001982 [Escallonia herrerae]|uniref:Uncharacterized protein n=1 Tax=Escallonia herrerae TaxID=1293975 RepID=A0AA88XIJ2_9ASTE|nr:hypothetical protein RJ639_001982 [Escallonia herrerae]
MACTTKLLGPPQLNRPLPRQDSDTAEDPPLGYTENNSLTYLSTTNPCLDFFFHVVPSTCPHDLTDRLAKSWAHDSLTTVKLDLPEILYRLLEGSDVRMLAKEAWEVKKKKKGRVRKARRAKAARGMYGRKGDKREAKSKKRLRVKVPRMKRISENTAKVKEVQETARVLRKEREAAKAKKALERYHHQISTFFVECLKSDVRSLNSREFRQISLAAKWSPTIDSSYDKSTLLCESIARKVFPSENYLEYQGIEEAHYAYRVRDRLRKEVLVPLHKVLELPEVYMSANKWDTLPYPRVPSVAMRNYKELFLQHDNARFREYLDDDGNNGQVVELQWASMVDDLTKKGKLRNCIAVCDVSGSMWGTPMEVCVALGLLISELSEEPWKGKVITFSKRPELHMVEGESLKVRITSPIHPPNKVSLLEKTNFIRRMNWGSNTDFQKVFDQILRVAVDGNLNEDQMIKRVFVFSDMEFDQASRHGYSKIRPKGWETDYEVIQRKFKENGYSKVPEIVFWNLRDSPATPVAAKQSGVALVSGFSKNILTLFLEESGPINPHTVMEEAISGELYRKLAVLD